MKVEIKHFRNKLAGLIVLVFVVVIILSNTTGTITAGNGGRTGSSFDLGTCGSTGCHSGGTFLSPFINIRLYSGTSLVTSYVPGASYTLKIQVGSSSISTLGFHYGFQVTCAQSATLLDVNGWGTAPTGTHAATWGSRNYVEQASTLISTLYPSISIPWTAPVAGTGNVTFYGGGCLVNNNGTVLGDKSVNDSLTITEGCVPPGLGVTETDISCFGMNDGTITLTASGGSGATGYTWMGPGGFTASTANLLGLAPGTYSVVVTAAGGGCSDSTFITVAEPPAILISDSSNSPVCSGNTLLLFSSASGGIGTLSYSWGGPGSFSSIIPNSAILGITPAGAGTYSITVTDLNGCTASSSLAITVNASPLVSLGPDTTLCPGDSLMLGAPPIPGDSYLWSTGSVSSSLYVSPGTYYLTVTNSTGCIGSDTIIVHVGCPTAVNNLNTNPNIILFPNPGTNQLTINTGLTKSALITIINNIGQTVLQQLSYTSQTMLDVATLPSGIYFIKIKTDTGNVEMKFDKL